ncbi:MAG: helix-turn-helix transcriptional regulator [Bacilli bacterium]|jgi:transcriptional regulator with XRE-family HTH domain|nr:helix-turn-helix transcriptional regulator [Bacilli bacterium]
MELNEIVAMNIVELRKEHNWTQAELAAKLNYTDKAISKWERGESIPELATLKQLAEMFGVTIDYITSPKPKAEKKDYLLPGIIKTNRILITAISTSIVLIIATIVFVYAAIYLEKYLWTLFVWSVPAGMICLYFFNWRWGEKKFTFYIVTVFLWSILTAIFLETMQYNTWLIFIIGIPIQITVTLIGFLKK